MSTMMINSKRKSRPNTSARGGRSARGSVERILDDGVYGNCRFINFASSLVGCVIKVQVKNGYVFEGVFKTFSPKMEVVLSVAHRVDDPTTGNSLNSPNSISSVPCKERIFDQLVISGKEIIVLTALNVDLDYALKDNFTDSAVSKFNGQLSENDLKELQPWESEGGDELTTLEGDASNGWDPNDMFRTNAEQFNVRSTYDENLSQYTTPLERKNTKEYKQREEEAAKIADEIEKSEQYRQRIALENGEGEDEEKFSAVQKHSEVNNTGSGKFIPVRKSHQMQNRTLRNSSSPNQGVNKTPLASMNTSPPQNRSPVSPVIDEVEIKVNGTSEKEDKKCDSPSEHSPIVVAENKTESVHNIAGSKVDRRNSTPKARDVQLEELKQFSTNFKLDDTKEKEKKLEKHERAEKQEERKVEEKKELEKPDRILVTVKNSTLNPNAKEFNPKTFQAKHPGTIPTSPRPQTQSPVTQLPQMPPTLQSQQIYSPTPYMVPTNMMSMQTPQGSSPQGTRYPAKRAVVSVQPPTRHDFSAAAQAAAATGQPLLAQPQLHPQYIHYYNIQFPQPTHTGYSQIMPVTQNPGTRMMTPTSVPMVSSSHPAAMDPSSTPAQHSGPIFVTGHTPVPAHVAHHATPQPLPHPTPAHMGPHPGATHSQSGQMNAQSGGGHPSPSPVQTQGPSSQQGPHPHGQPPPSGTPQPQMNYPQMGIQGHPPLQPSPHNPTSPQSVHPVSLSYPVPSHTHMPGTPQIAQAHPPTSTPHTIHTQGHQILMMQPGHTHHMQPAPIQHGHQFHGHPMHPPHMHGQGHHMIPQQAIPISTPSNVHPTQMHFVPHHQGIFPGYVLNQVPRAGSYNSQNRTKK